MARMNLTVLSLCLLGYVLAEEDSVSLIQGKTSLKADTDERPMFHGKGKKTSGADLPMITSDKFHSKLMATQAEFKDRCPERARRNECEVARSIVSELVRIAQGHASGQAELALSRSGADAEMSSGSSTESALTMKSATAVALHHWLHTKRPFEMLDADQSGKISYQEAETGFRHMGLTWNEGEGMFPIMDNDHDGELSRDDMLTFLRAAVMIREKIPAIDLIDPEGSSSEAFHQARAATLEGYPFDDSMPFGWKAILVIFIPIIACGLHFLFKSYGPQLKRQEI